MIMQEFGILFRKRLKFRNILYRFDLVREKVFDECLMIV